MNINNRYYGLIGRLFSYAGQFFVIIILPMVLKPEIFVKYNLIVPVLTLLSSVCYGWLNGAAFRWAHKIMAKKQFIMRGAIVYFYTVTLLLSIIFGEALYIAGMEDEAMLPLVVYFISVKDYFMKISNASEEYKKFSMGNIMLFIGKVFFIAYLYIFKIIDIKIVLTLFLISELFFLLPFIKIKAKIEASKKNIDPQKRLMALKKLIGYGAPMVASSIAVWIVSLSDRYILSMFLQPHDVANYVLVYQFAANSITIPLMFFITVYYPRLIRMEREDGLGCAMTYNAGVLKKYFIIAPLFGIVSATLIWVALQYIYADYNADFELIGTIVLAQIVCGAGHFYNKKYELNNKTYYIALSVFLAAVVNTASNFITIPTFGLMGAASSSLIAYLFLMAITPNIDKIIKPKAVGQKI